MNRPSKFPGLRFSVVPDEPLHLVIQAVIQGLVEIEDAKNDTQTDDWRNCQLPYKLRRLGYFRMKKIFDAGARNDTSTIFYPTRRAYAAAHYWAEEYGPLYSFIQAWRRFPDVTGQEERQTA